MHEHGTGMIWGSSLIGNALGLFAPYLGLFAALAPWQAQAIVVLVTSPVVLTITHFLKRYLNKRWPDRNKRRSGDTGE